MSNVLTVFGATGVQGGSVVRAVLNHPELSRVYKIRAVTRDTLKPAAKMLEAQGVDVVQADLDDRESIFKAISGSHAVFGVTNFWEKANFDIDVAQGKNLADAAKEAGVKHLIWSSLPDVMYLSEGKITDGKAFDSKARVEAYIRELGIPATFYMSGVFMSNLKMGTRKTPDGYVLTWPLTPATKMPLVDAGTDTGKWVAAILSNPAEAYGKRFAGSAGLMTPGEMVATISEVAGIKVAFEQIPDEVFKSFLPPSQASMRLAGLVVCRELNYYGPDAEAQIQESWKILAEKPTSFKEFVEKNLPWTE